ncbi:lipopolysaccharide-induced tumor necrosis factor-alpha factor homolog isoform X2 [Ischnura elegans]|uniref:lipopolysaccharide-induced tumor necrosis factor-alpha factor homolog isoform X2 n=1 Tax=Ischnura elegans TaxID=197161 RepID=UPI001ED8BCDA|nr:lipopolysaccharide-induced tumor necrosis factor-alpha factor homolog isoform X2 [Ischnura elegans]
MNVSGDPGYPKQAPPPYSPPGAPGPSVSQPYGWQPPPGPSPIPPATTITVVQVPTVTRLGPVSACVTCPSCQATVHTRIENEPSSRTHLIAVLLCLFCMWPFCLIPYCLDSCQSSNHYCPSCGAFLGSFTN